MSKKVALTDVPGVGPAMETKLRESGVKTVQALSKANPEKLAQKIDGLSEAGAGKLISAAKSLLPEEPKKGAKKAEKKAETPKAKPEVKEAKPKAKPKKAEAPKTTKATEKKPPKKKKSVSEKKKEPSLEAKTAAKPKKSKEPEAAKAKRERIRGMSRNQVR